MNESALDIMQPCRVAVFEDDAVADAAIKMLGTGRQMLPVVDQDGMLLGVLNAARLPEIQGHTIMEGIQSARLIVGPDVSSLELIGLMCRTRVEYAFVLDCGRLIGEVTWQDVKKQMSH